VVTEIRPGHGTDELCWTRWPEPAGWPRLHVAGHGPRVVVLAAHPDDEVLGAGGLVAALATSGADLLVVWATDGEASHAGSTAVPAAHLAAVRRAESASALALLGAGAAPRRHLALPDGGLADREPDLAEALRAVVRPGDTVVAPWSGDGHPDHEACGRAARAVAPHVLEYPVWMWHWARPGDDRVPWSRARRLDLDGEARERKAAAVACFASQLRPLGPAPEDGPVLPPQVLAHFARDHEVVLA
jgi:LmbE family N-acetylglucosaminyl deacetylase